MVKNTCFGFALLVLISTYSLSAMADPPNATGICKVNYISGGMEYRNVQLYNAQGIALTSEAWLYNPQTGVPHCNGNHKTVDQNAFQHSHTSHWSLPAFTAAGAEVTKEMIAAYWKKFFDDRYGVNQYTQEGEPNLTHNCHSYALGTTSYWNDLSPSFLVDGYDQTLSHQEALYYGLQNANYGNYVHSLKKESSSEIGSGVVEIVTKEKFRESQIFVKTWTAHSDDDPPGSVNGPTEFTGHKWKPE